MFAAAALSQAPKLAPPLLKLLLFAALAVPLALLGFDVWREVQLPGSGLGPDPGEEAVHRLGTWGLRVLLLTLAVSPASRLFRRPRLIRFRRMTGLWAFAYILLHFTAYLACSSDSSWPAWPRTSSSDPTSRLASLPCCC